MAAAGSFSHSLLLLAVMFGIAEMRVCTSVAVRK
jgi:hypothetical protein